MYPESAINRMRIIQENQMIKTTVFVRERIPTESDNEGGKTELDPERIVVYGKLFEQSNNNASEVTGAGGTEAQSKYIAHVPVGSDVLTSDRLIINADVTVNEDTGLYQSHIGGEYVEIENIANLDPSRTVDKLYLLRTKVV